MRRSAGRVAATDVGHVVVFRDPHTYAAHPNRGGIWAFPDGEVAVAHLVHDVCQPVHEQACVRYVAGTLFRLQHLSKAD